MNSDASGRETVLLVNPRAARWRFRIPLSVLSIGAALEGRHPYAVHDGNIEPDLESSIRERLKTGGVRCIGMTVMPGPQLPEAIRLSQMIRRFSPGVSIVWGGYFPTLHTRTVLNSGLVDAVVRGQGERAFPAYVEALTTGRSPEGIPGVSFVEKGEIRTNPEEPLLDPNMLPPLPYERVPVERYLGRTVLGARTLNYHSSVGCPFLCGFCAVAAISRARWIGLEPERVVKDLSMLQARYGVDAVEFHDNNFFVSENRTAAIAGRLAGAGIRWWGEARPDTVMRYDDATLRAMQHGGCRMIFFGAESGSAEVLLAMSKGGTQTPDTVLALADRLRRFSLIPEFSFVLGTPAGDVETTVEQDITFIRAVKEVNPESEIVIYLYSPVLFEDAELYRSARAHDFVYPERLEDWLLPPWDAHDMRRRPVAPWISPAVRRRIHEFDRVLNARFPTKTDIHLRPWQRLLLGGLGTWRYSLKFYNAPYELLALHRLFRYRQPREEGL